MRLRIDKLINITSGAKTFVSLPINRSLPLILHCFQRLVKTYHLLLDHLKACQNVLIGNIRLLMLSFIATTFRYVLNKGKYRDSSS